MGFRIGWDVMKFVGSFIFYCCVGFAQIVIYMQIQRFCTLLLIISIVLSDIYFIAPGCTKFSESCIHVVVLLAPFTYLYIVGKKGGIQ